MGFMLLPLSYTNKSMERKGVGTLMHLTLYYIYKSIEGKE